MKPYEKIGFSASLVLPSGSSQGSLELPPGRYFQGDESRVNFNIRMLGIIGVRSEEKALDGGIRRRRRPLKALRPSRAL